MLVGGKDIVNQHRPKEKIYTHGSFGTLCFYSWHINLFHPFVNLTNGYQKY